MREYSVIVYEPSSEPDGLQGSYNLWAFNEKDAGQKAINHVAQQFRVEPKTLDVFRIEEVPAK